ncbi:Aerobic respiration control sensor protein ArcB [Sedimentisphaera cyanobacteriorum]|uniref:histidine kinase n=1 Tax=Sedimentisphaera cyanobacteriorum TaxID=1940790 RepID=A0A1Q2HS16_9BACT|nr:PAS domain S-box protein [Sedimentisphaera cyanobacteriorum]AQQ10247.1 Aerobic respiration control sensor protein ArcB [Sedimentisphaera cyanobacteriorum]
MFDDDGRFLRRFGAIQDVTEQKFEIERLRQREKRLEKAHNLSLTGYWSYDASKDEMVWSEQLYSILEVDKSIKPSQSFFINLIHPEDQKQYSRLFENSLNLGGLDSFDCNFRILLKDGRIKWLEGFTEVIRGEKGEAIFLNGYLRDVSSLKLQREVFDTSSSVGDVGVFDLNLSSGKLKANKQWFVNNGLEYRAEEQDISIILEKLHPEDRKKINKILADCAAGKTKQFSADLRVNISPERYKWTKVSAQVKDYLPASNIIRLVGVVLDINEIKKAETASRINEDKFKSMFDNAPLPYQSLNEEGRFIEVNPAWLEHLGYSKKDVVGRWFGDFVTENYKDAFKEKFKEFQNCGEIDNVIFEMIKADGNLITVSFQGRFPYDLEGNPVKSHCVFRDITEELESIKTIRLLSKFPSENPNPVLRMSEIGELYYTNKAGEEFVEINENNRKLKKEFKDQVLIECCISSTGVFNYKLGKKTYRISYTKISPDNYINIYASDISKEIEARKRIDDLSKFPEENPNPVLRISPEGGVLYSNEAAKKFTKFEDRKEVLIGAMKDKAAYISPKTEVGKFETANNGRIYNFWYSFIDPPGYINLYGTDITDRKSAELEKQKQAENLRITLNSIGDAVIAADTQGIITLMNPNAEKLLGIDFSKAEGRPVSEILNIKSASTGKKAPNPVKEVLKTGREFELSNDTVLTSADQNEYQIADSAAPIKDDKGNITGVVLVFRDITEQYKNRKRIEESEKELKRAQEIGEIGSWKFNMNTSEVTASAQTCKIYGLDPEKNYTIPDVQKIPLKKYRKQLDEAIEKLISGEKKYDEIFKIKRPSDGKIRWIHPVAEYNKDENVIRGTLQDITESKEASDKLAQSEAKLRSYIDNAPFGVFVADSKGRYIEVNPCACRLTGYSREELTKMSIPDMLTPESKKLGEQHFKQLVQMGLSYGETEHFHKNGERRWWSVSAVKLSEDRFLGFTEDITEKKKTLLQLEQSEENLRITLDSIGDAVISTDLQGRIVLFNPVAEKLTGFSLKEAQGRDIFEVFNIFKGGTNEPAENPVEKVLEKGIIVGLANHTVLTSKDGSEYQIADSGAPIRNSKGKMTGVVLVFRDVTKEYEYQRKIRENEERFNKVLHTIPDMVSIHDRDMNIVFSNWNGFAAVAEEKRFTGTKCYKTYRGYDDICPDCKAGEVLNAGKQIHREAQLPDGRWFDIRVMPIAPDGEKKCQYFVEWVRDITELKNYQQSLEIAAEEAEKANMAKSRFLANMSHEIRTPLNAIIGYGNIVRQSNLDPVVLKHVESMNIAGKSLLALVNDVLDLSRIDAGKFTVSNKPLDIGSLMNELEAIFEHKITSKGLKFNLSKELTVNGILIDGTRLRQILVNLLGNAAKFTEKGHIDLKAGVYRSSEKSDLYDLEFAVSDTGAGIKKEDQKKIFESFEQIDGGPTKKHQGSGLGLSISAKLAELIGGELSVESEIGKGSTFRLHLPKRKYAEIDSYDDRLENVVFSPCKAVAVEDDEDNLKVLCELLKLLNLEAVPFDSGRSAVEYFEKNSAPIVLCDLRMPGLAGDETVKQIKQTKLGAKARFIAVTADIFEKQHYDISLFDDVLHKPVSKADLVRVIKKYVDSAISKKTATTKNKGTGEKLNKNIKLSKKDAEKYKEQIYPLVEEASSAGLAMKPITELTGTISIFAEENKNEELKVLAQKLDFAAKSFDINQIDECFSILKELGR